MEKRISWWYLIIPILAILIVIIIGDIYLTNLLTDNPTLLETIRPTLHLGGLILITTSGLVFFIARRRIAHPLNQLVYDLRQHIDGTELNIDSLHFPGDLSPLLYSIEILKNSYQLQIQDAELRQETLRSVLDQITDGIVMVNQNGEVSSLNPAAEVIFNIQNQDAKGHTVAEVLRQHQWIELYRSCLETGLESSTTLEIPSQKVFLQGIAIPPDESLPGYTLMVFQDLSQIRRLETTRQDFISNISHELRTPLASLKALTETLQDGALDDSKAARRFINRIDTEVDALSQMVTELLELSRIESGRVPLELQAVSPAEILRKSSNRMRSQADRGNLTFIIEASENLPMIYIDARRIEQVMVNLLHNAIKFSEAGKHIHLLAEQEDGGITFCVEDFGTGISETDLERIFERFYKTDQARSSGGTGLGLSIAKHIVEAHQGRIWAESTLNQGSRFFFWIPLQDLSD
jgi:two-component system phosphate regulon sensor histidine kinase PhoR